jgi:predicted AAA+ superfamily ATPase
MMSRLRGALIEAFVLGELRKQLTWSKTRAAIHFYRDLRGHEVDFLLENSRGDLVAIEVKATSNPSTADADGIRRLSSVLGDRLKYSYLLHTGSSTVQRSSWLIEAPISTLWRYLPGSTASEITA